MQITHARSAEEIDPLRPAWAALAFRSIDADLDVVLAVSRTRDEVKRPHVMLAERDGEPAGMLIARLEERPFPARFGYAAVFKPVLRCLTVVYGGIAGDPEAQTALVKELRRLLAAREADAVLFHQARLDSELYGEIESSWSGPARQRFVTPATHRARALPESVDALMTQLPKSLRDNLKRYDRKFARDIGARAEVRKYHRSEQAGAAAADLELVASRSYQRGLGGGFRMAEDGPLMELGLADEWFRAWVLAIEGKAVAYEMGTVRGGSYVLGAKGYDPDYGRMHVGKVLQVAVLRDLCDDPEVDVLDFGFGDADYKERMADRGWDEADILIYGRTRRALAANAGRTVVIAADALARRLAGEDRVANIKRRWRTLRTPRTSTTDQVLNPPQGQAAGVAADA